MPESLSLRGARIGWRTHTMVGTGLSVQRWSDRERKETLMISRTVVVASSVGLHARPAALLAEAVDESGVDVLLSFGED